MKVEEFGNGAVREDKEGKGRFDLLPWCAIMRIAKHMQESLKVYEPRNWEKGLPMHSMLDSAMRHLAKYMDGWTDEDHLCAAATNLLMAMWTEEKMPEMQDIPSRMHGEVLPCASGMETPEHRDRNSKCKEEATKSRGEICSLLTNGADGVPRCTGTKEMDPCKYDGDREKCDEETLDDPYEM